MKKIIISMIVVIFVLMSIISCDIFGGEGGRSFWVSDLPNEVGTWKQISAKLIYQNTKANVWAYGELSESLAKEYGDYFMNNAWSDVTTYVYEPTNYFKEEGNRINILFYTPDDSQGWAGYFWAKDFYDNSTLEDYGSTMKSNETNVFYMHLEYSSNDKNKTFMKATLTHEFQHMAQAHYFLDKNGMSYIMDTWANELCSITMDSVFGGLAKTRVSDYNYGNGSAYKNGIKILGWDNAYEQYTVTGLFGMYLFSALSESARANFITSWLAKTNEEAFRSVTSVHSLISILESSTLAYWTSTTNYTNDNAVQVKWSSLLGNFLTGLVTETSSYRTYIKSKTDNTDISPAVLTSGGEITLKPSAWVIAEVNANDLTSTTGCETGTTSAYMVAYHDGLPGLDGSALILPDNIDTCSISLVETAGKQVESTIEQEPIRFISDKKGTQNFSLTNTSSRTENTRGVVSGQVSYFYVGK